MIDYLLSILMILSSILFLILMVLFILAPKYAKKELFTSYYSGTGAIYHGFKLFRVKYSSLAVVVIFLLKVFLIKLN